MNDFVYDIESYPNVFTIAIEHIVYEISHRVNDIDKIIQALDYINYYNGRMVGFNNEGFDYPVLDYVIKNRASAMMAYTFMKSIIDSEDRFSHIIWDKQQYVPQVDLFKIHHFDNMAKATSLKVLEFNMRSQSIQDLPFPVGTYLTDDQIDQLKIYNLHDVSETRKFLEKSRDEIKFREELTEKYGKNFINSSDGAIGRRILIMELEKINPGSCYNNDRSPKQTIRSNINLSEVILPYIKFNHPNLKKVLEWLKSQRIRETKGLFKKLEANVDGFTFVFGLGGIHGSLSNKLIKTDNEGEIIDVDVTSYYPSLTISNKMGPEHLGSAFYETMDKLKSERKKHKKGTVFNKAYKDALNISWGSSGSFYTPFYDLNYTMGVTLSGQLLLCMLAEQVMNIPGLQMIQANTDGITVKCPHNYIDHFREIYKWWEKFTCLDLEEVQYSRMWIRDVNNYVAEYSGTGKLKQKGAYSDEPEWHKNQSALIVPKAAKAAIVNGDNIEDFIYNHTDKMDFLLRTKVPRTSILLHGDRQIQNVSRYYISTDGQPLLKIMPPLKKKPNRYRSIGINVGWLTTECNNWNDSLAGINYKYYIEETKKLVEPLTEVMF